jgi:nitroreductase
MPTRVTQVRQDDLFLKAAGAAPSPDNAQHWRFVVDGDQATVLHRRGDAIDPFGPAGHATLIGVGAMFENVAQAARAIDRPPPAWLEAPGERFDAGYFRFGLSGLPWHDQADLPLFGRHTNRFRFSTRPLPQALIDAVDTAPEPGLRVIPVTPGDCFEALGRVAHVCCQARFCDQELHDWLMSSIRFSEGEVARGDGIDIATIDLPPGGGAFMRFIRPWPRMAMLNRLRAYTLMAAQEVVKMRNASALLCLVGEATADGALAAGALMERLWIALNAAGWGVHPYYVIADQWSRQQAGRGTAQWRAPVRTALAELDTQLGIASGERLHMMLRVGWPTRPDPVRSRRLPVAQLLDAD